MAENNRTENRKTKPGSAGKGEDGVGIFDLLFQGLAGIPQLMRSLSFAIWVIIIIAILTLAGTILPQEHLSNDPVDYGLRYQALFDVNPDDGVNSVQEFFYYYVVKRLQLYNIFKTTLYFMLLVLLTISAVLCAWDRFGIAKKLLSRTDPVIKPESVRQLKYSTGGKISGDSGVIAAELGSKFKKAGFQVFEKECEDGRTCFFGRKNAFRFYASVAFHCALVFILVGGLIGDERMFAYDGTIALSEGERQPIGSVAHSKWQEESRSKPMAPPFVPEYPEQLELIDYTSIYRERDFGSIDPETGFPAENYMSAPSDYISHVKIIRPNPSGEDQVLVEKTVQVNFPLRYGGIGYYQSSVNNLMTFTVTEPSGNETRIEAFQFDQFDIPGLMFGAEVRNGDIVGGIWESEDGTQSPMPYSVKLVDYNAQMRGMSASPVLLGYVREGKPLQVGDVEIRLDSVKEYSIFSYNHDPGVPIVYFGFLILSLGVTLTLYMPYRTGRLVVSKRKDGVEWVAGSTWDGFTAIFEGTSKE